MKDIARPELILAPPIIDPPNFELFEINLTIIQFSLSPPYCISFLLSVLLEASNTDQLNKPVSMNGVHLNKSFVQWERISICAFLFRFMSDSHEFLLK